MRLIANRSFRYHGRQLHAGDAFDAGPTDAAAWKAIRYAADAPNAAPPPPKPAPAEPAPKHQPERPGYRTRRLKADDD